MCECVECVALFSRIVLYIAMCYIQRLVTSSGGLKIPGLLWGIFNIPVMECKAQLYTKS